MAKKYNYGSPVAAGLGLAVAGAASMNPVTTPFAGPLGTLAAGVFGGVDLSDEEINLKDKFDEAINKTWDQIFKEYNLTDVCFSKLKQEVIGENTSPEEFVNNYQRKKLKDSYAMVTQTILEKFKGGLEQKSKKTWDDAYIEYVSKDIASRLTSTLQNVYDEEDLLKILFAITNVKELNRNDHDSLAQQITILEEHIKTSLGEIIRELQNQRTSDFHSHYVTKHLAATENAKTPYVKDERLFEIMEAFIDYNWSSEAQGLLNKEGKKLPKKTKEEISEFLFSTQPFENRRLRFMDYSNCSIVFKDPLAKVFRDKLIQLTFGNCLFISGRYGIGKTRLLKNMEVQSDSTKTYVCYLDLLDTNGLIDELVITKLINSYFGKVYENMESFLLDYLESEGKRKIILMVDNLDFAFQRGLQPEKLLQLIASYSICDQIKWIFTMQSEQRFFIWPSTDMEQLASEYGFICVDEPYKIYFRGNDLDMNILYSDARVFESILQKANSVNTTEGICLRIDHKYDAYLTPFVAELLVRLKWKWEDITKAKSLAYLDLCQSYKKRIFENLTIFNKGTISMNEWERICKNLCVEIGWSQLNTGQNFWEKKDISSLTEQSLISLELEEVIKKRFRKDNYGYIIKRYIAIDQLFWSEQTADNLLCYSDSLSWEDKLNACTVSANPVIAQLPYLTDMQRLYYMQIFQKKDMFDLRSREFLAQGIIPENINSLFSTQFYPLAADALSYAGEESQKIFFESSLIYLKGLQEHMDKLDTYTFTYSFFEFCSATTLSKADWKKLVSYLPTKFTGLLMKNIVKDFSTLLWKKQSELNGDLLGCILAYLGNEDAGVFKPIVDMLSTLYFEEYQDNRLLIKTLLKDQKLRNLGKRYITSKDKKKNPNKVEKGQVLITQRDTFPFCIVESTISNICNEIIFDEGIIDGYNLFWSCKWYAEDIKGKLPFFVDLRRKSLNLALTDHARKMDCMCDLENVISKCLNYQGNNSHLRKIFKEEALFLCKNSVLAEDRSPWSFTDAIYEHLTAFVNDPSMSDYFKREDIRNFYRKHNLFALFHHQDVIIGVNRVNNKLIHCHIEKYTRDSITVTIENDGVETIQWYEISYFKEKQAHSKNHTKQGNKQTNKPQKQTNKTKYKQTKKFKFRR